MYKKTFILLLEFFTLSWSTYTYGEVEGRSLTDAKEIVRRYSEATSWDKTVAMNLNVETNVTSNKIGQGNTGRRRMELIFRRDHNRSECIGNDELLDSAGKVIDEGSFDFARIINDKLYLSAEKHPELGRFLGHIKRDLEREQKFNLLDPTYGGFLEGNVPGVGELKTIAGRLIESDNLLLVGAEKINDISCYVIEAKSIYGKFKVWIAPDKGYNALKYTVSKTGHDLFNGKPIEETKVKEWQLQVDSVKVQKIDDIYVPVEGQFTDRTIYKSGYQESNNVKVKRSDIDLNPDFETLSAFTFNLPDGTVIQDYDFPGVRYKIFGSELVPDVDKAAIEQIDRITEELKAEGEVPAGLATDRKTEASPNKTSATLDELPGTAESQEKVIGESRSFPTLVFILIGLSIIAIIIWRVFLVKGR